MQKDAIGETEKRYKSLTLLKLQWSGRLDLNQSQTSDENRESIRENSS
jgi:hypothetical protein